MRCVFLACAALAAACSAACSSEDDAICDAASLEAALSAAGSSPPQQLRIGACRIEGGFVVPAGVFLRGTDRTTSVLIAPVDRPALDIAPGAGTISDLTVESDGIAGVLARGGAGAVTIERVDVRATRGLAAGFEGLSTLVLRDVRIDGGITAERAAQLPPEVTSQNAPAYGLVLVRVANAQLDRVSVDHFARFGAALIESDTTWTNGRAVENVGTGVVVIAGRATLSDVAVDRTRRPTGPDPAYALVATATATLDTTRASTSGSGDFGLIFDAGSSGTATQLTASDNVRSGVWLQRARDVTLAGTLANNGIGAIIALDSSNLTIRDATITGTRESGSLAFPGVADGIHAVRTFTGVRLENLDLDQNDRAGVLFDLGGNTLETATFGAVRVTASMPMAYGAIVQNGQAPMGWDSNVMRLGSAAANDLAFTGRLGTVSGIQPCYFPIDPLQAQGLAAIVGP